MKYGTVTDREANYSFISSNGNVYRFATYNNEVCAEVGDNVWFEEDTESMTQHTKYAKNIALADKQDSALKDILKRLIALEEKVLSSNRFTQEYK